MQVRFMSALLSQFGRLETEPKPYQVVTWHAIELSLLKLKSSLAERVKSFLLRDVSQSFLLLRGTPNQSFLSLNHHFQFRSVAPRTQAMSLIPWTSQSTVFIKVLLKSEEIEYHTILL